ncbi:MAG: hypothetical protein M2R45_01097 [Verrucomicrobia subdivision 3 bacterium]|nr:hypothetical protein [Limisphaerales bacterium]MCS1414208.1 hypothetical protein [Limisphaerales bacterium]
MKKKTVLIAAAAFAAAALFWFIPWQDPGSVGPERPLPEHGGAAETAPTGAGEANRKTQGTAVFDLSKKAHYYDPETTMDSIHKLAWVLEPFHPTPQEFQHIARYLTGIQEVKKRISEDAFFTPAGRRQFGREVDKLEAALRKQLGRERYERYEYTTETPGAHKTGYSEAWRLATANGLDEERAEDLRALATEYHRVLRGTEIDGRTEIEGWERWEPPEDEWAIHASFMERIRQEFGEPVLADIMASEGSSGLFPDLGGGYLPEDSYKTIWNDPATKQRMEDIYGVKATIIGPDSSPEELREAEEQHRELERLMEKEDQYRRLLWEEREALLEQRLREEQQQSASTMQSDEAEQAIDMLRNPLNADAAD